MNFTDHSLIECIKALFKKFKNKLRFTRWSIKKKTHNSLKKTLKLTLPHYCYQNITLTLQTINLETEWWMSTAIIVLSSNLELWEQWREFLNFLLRLFLTNKKFGWNHGEVKNLNAQKWRLKTWLIWIISKNRFIFHPLFLKKSQLKQLQS